MSTDFQTFDVTREIAARPETVYRTWAEPDLKRRWFAADASNGWHTEGYEADLRVGGVERGRFLHDEIGGFDFEARYIQMRAPGRLVYSYTMATAETLLSASLATVCIHAHGPGSRVIYTEQAVFLDGGDRRETRQAGTADMIAKMTEIAMEVEDA
ncbi:SRPBCC domain-containing protein [Rhodophyticola porphyridii]|uniref:ATPase n=1 Tax=Rhodophyticola porphyridii TaxID=1852017 RepID=A0A3L9Y990_9RHOB|nr:SRPBCC domain-containing protein [Rhodophyticola porphyridii]RMA43848.1 ATPase [Rhodophyticola porphyridii]